MEMVLYTEKEVLDALEEIIDHPVYSQILHLYLKELITDQQRQEQLGEDHLYERDDEFMLSYMTAVVMFFPWRFHRDRWYSAEINVFATEIYISFDI